MCIYATIQNVYVWCYTRKGKAICKYAMGQLHAYIYMKFFLKWTINNEILNWNLFFKYIIHTMDQLWIVTNIYFSHSYLDVWWSYIYKYIMRKWLWEWYIYQYRKVQTTFTMNIQNHHTHCMYTTPCIQHHYINFNKYTDKLICN